MRGIAGAVTFLFLFAVGSTRADSLFFKAQPDANGGVNYNWFSPSNWFQPDNMGVLQPVNKIPGPGDNAFILTAVNAAANAITLATLVVEPGVGVSGGDFTAGQVATAAGASFTNSSIQVLAQMYVGGGCTMNACVLTVGAGAFCLLNGPQTNNRAGMLFLSNSTIFNIGEIILTNGSSITGGSNLVNRGYISSSGTAAVSGAFGAFDNSGVVQCSGGLLTIGPFAVWTNSLAVGQYRTLATNSTIQFGMAAPGPAFSPNTTNLLAGPGTNLFPYGATVNGLLEVGASDPSTHAVDPGLAVLSSEAVILNGSGVVHVVAAPTSPSTLAWNGGSISGVQVNIDPGGQFTLSGSADRYLSGATVNNAGATTTKTQGIPLHLNNGAVFNNLGGGLFDAQNDAAIVGSGGGVVGRFNNAGTFRKSAGTNDTWFTFDNGADTTQTPVFNNSGLLDVQTGRVGLGGGTNAGQFNVAGGARLRFLYNTNVQIAGAIFTGPGQVNADTGFGPVTVLLLQTDATIQDFLMGDATVDGPGDLTVNGTFTWSGGSIQGGGALNLRRRK